MCDRARWRPPPIVGEARSLLGADDQQRQGTFGRGDQTVTITSCQSGWVLLGDIVAWSAREGLDDNHTPATAGARMRERLLLGAAGVAVRDLWRRGVEQPTCARDILGASAIGEEAVVANAVETAGQHVDE